MIAEINDLAFILEMRESTMWFIIFTILVLLIAAMIWEWQ
jgi:hypothetical protein